MDYVLIKNGKIVDGTNVLEKDLLIGNNKILAIEDNLERPEPETPVIDAGGKYLMPGALDINISFFDACSQEPESQRKFNQAEIVGGTTTVLETIVPGLSDDSSLELLKQKKRPLNVVPDYGFHLSLQGWDRFDEKELDYCYSHEGITSFFLQWPLDDEGEIANLIELIKTAAQFDLLLMVEMDAPFDASNSSLKKSYEYEQAIKQYLLNLKRILDLSTSAGCKVLLQNICFREQIEIILLFKETGLVYSELMYPFYLGDSADYKVDKNSVFFGIPLVDTLSLISHEEFWELIKSDHFFIVRPSLTLSSEGVVKDSQVHNRPDEYFLIKNFLSVIYTSGVIREKISLMEFVSIMAERASKLMGLYPKKGVLRTGSDADLIIWDPDYERNIYCNFPQELDSKPISLKLKGRAEFVFVRGLMAYNGEAFSGDYALGSFLYRSPIQ
ncbi:amidohydrolase family protein [Carboxylicivirga sp. N1Y90]|uniref:amidohydrolase family protein n=1 Tax=Carboxylicivirga fragile TaxID=3417571 RepID=UPI003D341E1E|nr:amidohydrolase family protein [Marinilabiliaceae bacterium N1Y90]